MPTNALIASAYHDRRVLVTGGLGFIGSNLARRLADYGAEVTLVDNLAPGSGALRWNIASFEGQARLHVLDLAESEALLPIVAGQEYVFNLAGRVGHLDSIEDPRGDLRANLEAHLGLLEACRRRAAGATLVFTSTRQVYGPCAELPVTEDHRPEPIDVNGCHKLAAEHLHRVYWRIHGLRAVSLRLTACYGPRMPVRDARSSFLGLWIRRLLKGEPLEIFGDGEQTRDFNFVEDVVDAILAVAVNPDSAGSVYNLGDERAVSIAEMARLLIEINGGGSFRHVPFPDDRSRIELGSFQTDFGRIRRRIGWEPKVPLEEGLRQTLDYYRAHLPRYL